jgi:hypothetical protein
MSQGEHWAGQESGGEGEEVGHQVLEQKLRVGREGGEQEGEVSGCAGQESGGEGEEVGHQVLEQTLGVGREGGEQEGEGGVPG